MCDSAFILFLHAVLAGHLGPQEGQDPGGDTPCYSPGEEFLRT